MRKKGDISVNPKKMPAKMGDILGDSAFFA
jgi:hypothetical protein